METYITYIKVFVIVGAFVFESHGFRISLDDDRTEGGFRLSDHLRRHATQEQNLSNPSVHHYARHGLCRTFRGKQYLYKAMKRHLCGMRLSFTANLVIDLCRNRNKLLDNWVAELFDLDGDGRISHFERRLYVEDD